MQNGLLFRILLVASMLLAVVVFRALFSISAPYGRYARKGWGPQVPGWLGWVMMESVSALAMAILFLSGNAIKSMALIAFLLMWEAHYVHRAFIYPFTRRDRQKPMPLAVVLMGAAFNLGNAYINGHYLFQASAGRYEADWLVSAPFILGAFMFITGFVINRQADETLHRLRAQGEGGYKIPYGGLYRYISCPNYFGEILEWAGWAVATWSWAGAAFAVWTFANLAPRAWSHDRWYREHFVDYPAERKRLLPGVW